MSNGLTGRLFEYEVLAICHTSWDGHTYMPFQQSLRLIRENQPWDPTDPSTRQGEDLHCRVALALGLEDFSELSLLSAIGTPLDLFHGVDAVFQWKGRIVTVDLTTNPYKDSYRADVILRPEDESDSWQSAASEIARRLQSKGAYAA